MPGAMAGPGVVGDLVVLVARAVEAGIGREELRGVPLLVDRSHLAARGPPAERRVGLDREAVERQVLGLERERPLQIGGPVPSEAGREAEDEIQREVGEAGVAERVGRRSAIWPAVWVRCIQASTAGSNDCTPSETRLTPAARQAAAARG